MENENKFKVGEKVVLINRPYLKGIVESVDLCIANEGITYSYDVKIGEKLYINTIEQNLKHVSK